MELRRDREPLPRGQQAYLEHSLQVWQKTHYGRQALGGNIVGHGKTERG